MKKYVLIALCIFVVLISGCGRQTGYKNKKPDDDISHKVCASLNSDEVYYLGKEVGNYDIASYNFLFYKERQGQLSELVYVANKAVREQNTDEKIVISCQISIRGGRGPVIVLKNYSDDIKSTKAEYSDLQNASIYGERLVSDSIYNLPEIYRDLSNIKYLSIENYMADITERDNVDWNEYFPELESLEIISKEK